MFKSPFAGGIAWGLAFAGLLSFPSAFAYVTDTGLYGYVGSVLGVLIIAAVVAEIRARRKAA